MISIKIDADAAMIDRDMLRTCLLIEVDILQHIHATHDTQVGWRNTKKNMISIIDQCPRRDNWSGLEHSCLIELDILQHIHATHDAQVGWRSTINSMIGIFSDAYAAMIDQDMLMHAW